MVKAFFWGVWEFRRSFTRSYLDQRLTAYDWGRELAHTVTFRRLEP